MQPDGDRLRGIHRADRDGDMFGGAGAEDGEAGLAPAVQGNAGLADPAQVAGGRPPIAGDGLAAHRE